MLVDILSLFPDYFESPLKATILGRAITQSLLTIRQTNIRDFAEDKWHRVDDRPFGGGPGMVMLPGPTIKAIKSCKAQSASEVFESNSASCMHRSHVIYMSPQGRPFTASDAQRLATYDHLIILCGHYEGIDQRVIEQEVDEEISIGDYVLTNGCLAALVVLDAVSRFIPGVLGHEEGAYQDSFQNSLLDCPHYTRPRNFEGHEVPTILFSGDHEKIKQWRYQRQLEATLQHRPDLLYKPLIESERLILRRIGGEDLPWLAELMADSDVMQFSLKGALSYEETKEVVYRDTIDSYEKQGFGHWAVCLKSTLQPIGFCGLTMKVIDSKSYPELGYRLLKRYWGKGYATEAAIAVKKFALDSLKLPQVVSIIDPDNHASIRVALKNGLHHQFSTTYKGIFVQIYVS